MSKDEAFFAAIIINCCYMYHTGRKINILSKKAHVQNHIIHKIHIFKIAFLAKSTFFNSQFLTKITFQKQSFHITQISNSSEFMDKMCDLALVCVCTQRFSTNCRYKNPLPVFRKLTKIHIQDVELVFGKYN